MNYKEVLPNGVIKTNDNYIKILKIIPINFNLKSEMEKSSILNSYKIFLKTINTDIQIIIQSKKEDLSKHISNVEFQKNNENNNIKNISQNYIDYINELNKRKKSSTKNYYIIIKSNKYNNEINNYENIACDELTEKYLKIKDCLSRCGNRVIDINNKKELIDILFSFLNSQKFIFE
ncbi:MAG: hypothetical protein IKE91_00240 [Clostridia bacterium]|nr:hypothetical protein [Clostridia bacterium]